MIYPTQEKFSDDSSIQSTEIGLYFNQFRSNRVENAQQSPELALIDHHMNVQSQ